MKISIYKDPILRGLMFLSLASCPFFQVFSKEAIDYVNPMIGATTEEINAGRGRTFPGVATPFGMVQLSPDTITYWDETPGYSWTHNTLEGFSFMHMSGVGWYADFGNLLTTATNGPLHVLPGPLDEPEKGYRSRFSHDKEIAEIGYYRAHLEDYDIQVELTASPHAGMMRFTFPKSDKSRIQIDLARRIGGTSTRQYLKIVDEHTIEGWMYCPAEGGGWGHGKGKVTYKLYFVAKFSRPLEQYGAWTADLSDMDRSRSWSDQAGRLADGVVAKVQTPYYLEVKDRVKIVRQFDKIESDHSGFFVEFPSLEGEQVIMKAGFSFTSIGAAHDNLNAEIGDWDFDRVRHEARKLWSDQFAHTGIHVKGGSEDERTIFYTALYHSFIDPRIVSNVDGTYRGADGLVHQGSTFNYRTIFSGWDVFRSHFPLLEIIDPSVVNDEINTLIEIADKSGRGYFPEWEHMNSYTQCMLGDPALGILSSAWTKGIRRYDIDKAYQFAKKTSLDGWRPNKEIYNSKGFVPGPGPALSWTLESAFFDYSLGYLADSLGKSEDAELFYRKGQNYQNIFDLSVGSIRMRDEEGDWMKWKGLTDGGSGCVESNPLQQMWFVPHDVQGLLDLLGVEQAEEKLNMLFENTPENVPFKNPYYNHGNEPVHHVAYLWNYLGKPWKTQEWVRWTMDKAYSSTVGGLKGDDDVGQMSAWYIFSAIGFHPVNTTDDTYMIGSPIFDSVEIKLDPSFYGTGKVFRINVHDNSSENIFVQSAKLNGKALDRSWFTFQELSEGGVLELFMGANPNENWGSQTEYLPPSRSRPTNFQ